MSYEFPFTKIGRALYEKNGTEPGLERAVRFFVEKIGEAEWRRRRAAIISRFKKKLRPDPKNTPIEGISVRDTNDEIGWYLYLAETSIADPVSVEADQSCRILPYMCSFGLKLDAILNIGEVNVRIEKLVRELENQDPDQILFELLVGAAYVKEGWAVVALQENPREKTPDFEIRKGLQRYEVECKRFVRRSEYTTLERDAWLRLWKPASTWLIENGYALILKIDLSVEIVKLPADYLRNIIQKNIATLAQGRPYVEIGVCSIASKAVELDRISAHLEKNWVKRNSGFERHLLTGQYERDYGVTYAVHGRSGAMGDPSIGGNEFWEEVNFVLAAYWHCNAPEAINAKARDIKKRLSDATSQLSGRLGGIVHVGIEAAEGDDVELVRSGKIRATLDDFDPREKPLEWVYLHFFRGESLPNGTWAIDETRQLRGSGPEFYRPLHADFIVTPDEIPARDGAHWNQL